MAAYDGTLAPLTPALAAAALPLPLPPHLASLACPALFDEVSVYPLLSAAVPAWVTAKKRPAHATQDSSPASSLHGIKAEKALRIPFFGGLTLPWSCKPELLAPAPAWHPAYVAEAKSVDSHIFEELAVYAMLGMLASLFSHAPDGCATFFPTPPRAYGLAAFPHVAYLVTIEWVARASLHIASEPFFLGSAAHARAVTELPDHDYQGEAVHVDLSAGYFMEPAPTSPAPAAAAPGAAPPPALTLPVGGPLVAWTAAATLDGHFRKIVAAQTYPQEVFRRMHAAYAALAAARAAAAAAGDQPPAALLPARLLYGAGAVCVEMTWAPGVDAAPADFEAGGAAVAPVAAALAWLARQGLLYLDLRYPNVRVQAAAAARGGGEVDGPRVALVDYDDVVPATARITSFATLTEQLAAATAKYFPGMRGSYFDALPALAAALQDPRVRWAADAPPD
jgi:hypothetical protein